MTPAERNAIVEANLPLVWFHLRGRLTRNRGWVDGDDLVQEGRLGLMRAVEKYDPSKGRLSTYSRRWIRAYAQRALEDLGYSCHVPRKAWYDKPAEGASTVALEAILDRDDGLDDREAIDAVWATVGRLWDPARTILRLRYRDGLKQREVAERLGFSGNYVSWVEQRAIRSLRRRLAREECPCRNPAVRNP